MLLRGCTDCSQERPGRPGADSSLQINAGSLIDPTPRTPASHPHAASEKEWRDLIPKYLASRPPSDTRRMEIIQIPDRIGQKLFLRPVIVCAARAPMAKSMVKKRS